MSTASARPRAAHLGPERRRPQVLDAALAIALESGLGAVTVGAVAERMSVTRPVIYSCYSDRIELLEALLDREEEQLRSAVLDALHRSAGAGDPESAFVQGFRSLLAVVTSSPDAWRLILAGEPDADISVRFRRSRSELQRQSTEWIGPAVQAWWQIEDLERKLPVLIELFAAMTESTMRMVLSEDESWEPDELGEFVGQAVFRMFRDA